LKCDFEPPNLLYKTIHKNGKTRSARQTEHVWRIERAFQKSNVDELYPAQGRQVGGGMSWGAVVAAAAAKASVINIIANIFFIL
jgi:hypothetical protein